jgi:hypothetical protein
MAALREELTDSFQMSNIGVKEPTEIHTDITDPKSFLIQEQSLLPSNVGVVAEERRDSYDRGGVRESHEHRINWLYLSMIMSMLAGIVLAIGHHYFYHSLNGRIVGSVSSQQWSLR